MADKTRIAWSDATWNPITGCTKVSSGCKHCYAEREWRRLAAAPHTVYTGRPFTSVRVHPERFGQPLRWRRPRRIFVNSMSDLFHEAVSDGFIDQVLAVMLLAPHHTFQVLTKRPQRTRAYFAGADLYARVLAAANVLRADHPRLRLDCIGIDDPASPMARHIWWGVSVEDQKAADQRIPLLLEVPVANHWISAEPLLERIEIGFAMPLGMAGSSYKKSLKWVVVGGESGPYARPLLADWIRKMRDDCVQDGVPLLVKQLGTRFFDPRNAITGAEPWDGDDSHALGRRLRHRSGADPAEWPDDLRVREYPKQSRWNNLLPQILVTGAEIGRDHDASAA